MEFVIVNGKIRIRWRWPNSSSLPWVPERPFPFCWLQWSSSSVIYKYSILWNEQTRLSNPITMTPPSQSWQRWASFARLLATMASVVSFAAWTWRSSAKFLAPPSGSWFMRWRFVRSSTTAIPEIAFRWKEWLRQEPSGSLWRVC